MKNHNNKLIGSFLIIISLLSQLSIAYRINLEKKTIYSIQEEGLIDEVIYTTKMYFNDDLEYVDAIIDPTTSSSWLLTSACDNCKENNIFIDKRVDQAIQDIDKQIVNDGQGNHIFEALGSQIEFQNTQEKNKSKLSYIEGELDIMLDTTQQGMLKLKKTLFWQPINIVNPQSKQVAQQQTGNQLFYSKSYILRHYQAGLGLGPFQEFYRPLMRRIDSQIKLEQKVVSFYIDSNKDMKIEIGKPEDYYKKGDWVYLKNTPFIKEDYDNNANQSYSLYCKEVQIGKSGHTYPLTQNNDSTKPQYGVFNTNSRYIYFGQILTIQSIIQQINKESGADCKIVSLGIESYVQCQNQDAKMEDFPDLKFVLYDEHNREVLLTLKPENYVEDSYLNAVPSKLLLLKPGVYGQQSSSDIKDAQPDIWFGYPIFQQYYIAFDYDKNEIRIADKYNISYGKLGLTENFAETILITSILALIIFLVAFCSIVKQFPKGKWVEVDNGDVQVLRYYYRPTNRTELHPAVATKSLRDRIEMTGGKRFPSINDLSHHRVNADHSIERSTNIHLMRNRYFVPDNSELTQEQIRYQQLYDQQIMYTHIGGQ